MGKEICLIKAILYSLVDRKPLCHWNGSKGFSAVPSSAAKKSVVAGGSANS